MPIRIGIIHDDLAIKNRLKSAVEAHQPFLNLDYAIGSLAEMQRQNILNDYNPDILLVDMDMHEDTMAGMVVVDLYNKRRGVTRPKTIIISNWCDRWMVRTMKMKMNIGVYGCITTDDIFKQGILAHLITKVYDDHAFVTDADKQPTLTDNQKDILRKLANGYTIRAIAQETGRTEGGISATLFNLRKSFGVKTTKQLLDKTRNLLYSTETTITK